MRNLLARVPQPRAEMVAATVRTIFAQPDPASTHRQQRAVADTLRASHPQAADLLGEAEADVTAYSWFPRQHRTKIWSTTLLERLHREIKRRCDVVGIFPNEQAVICLVGAVLAEQHAEWQFADRRYLGKVPMALINHDDQTETSKEVTAHTQQALPATS